MLALDPSLDTICSSPGACKMFASNPSLAVCSLDTSGSRTTWACMFAPETWLDTSDSVSSVLIGGSYKISRNWFHFLIDCLHTSSFTTPSGLTIGQKLNSWIRYNQGCDVPARCTCCSYKLWLSVCASSMPCPCCRRCLPRRLHPGLDLHLLVLSFAWSPATALQRGREEVLCQSVQRRLG